MATRFPLVYAIDPGLRNVYTVSNVLQLLTLDDPKLHTTCTLSATSRRMKFFPYKMRGYGPLRSLVGRVTSQIANEIYGNQPPGEPPVTYRTLNVDMRDKYRDLRSREIAAQKERLYNQPCSYPGFDLPKPLV